MVLSADEIWRAMRDGRLSLNPDILPEQVATSSVDLRLGHQITRFPPPLDGFTTTVDLSMDIAIEEGIQRYGQTSTIAEGEPINLKPGDFVLAYTLERVELSNDIAARVEGRSTLGRMGISIHQTAPTVHAGFRGQLRLEISCNGPFPCILRPRMRICQLILESLGEPSTAPLLSRFQDQSSQGI